MTSTHVKSACQTISTRCLLNFNTPHQPDHNTLPTNIYHSYIDKLHKKFSWNLLISYLTGHQIHPRCCGHNSLLHTNPTPATALSIIISHQAKGTKTLEQAFHQLLDYVATHPHAAVWFLASDMILAKHTNDNYLSEQKAKSHAAAHFYPTNKKNSDFNDGAILTLSFIV